MPPPRGLDVLYEASGVLAVGKPSGLPTQAPPGIESVESRVREWLFGAAAATVPLEPASRRHPGGFLGVPHRLDRPVSGVVLLATTPRAARQLSRQFERRQIVKTYLARVAATGPHGLAVGDTFTWQDVVRKVPDEPRAEIVAADEHGGRGRAAAGNDGGRVAVTHGRVLAVEAAGTLRLELVPETGRMHQLRLQAAARGLPVVGDALYGGPTDAEGELRTRPIALHAWRIAFRDPDTGATVEIECPPPVQVA